MHHQQSTRLAYAGQQRIPVERRDPADLEYQAGHVASADDKQFASTLARGLEILRCFTSVKPVLGNKDLADRVGLSRPTISRFTYTLTKLGYLRGDPASGKYRLGPAVISLGYPLLASLPLRQLARPLMNELANEQRCSVSMGIRDRLSIVYVETSRATTTEFAQLSDIGLRYPIASSAIGRAFVAGCDTPARQALLNEIRIRTPNTWSNCQTRLMRAYDEFTHKGFCAGYGEQHPDFQAVAVPMGRLIDGELMVFNCVGPAHLISRRRMETIVGPKLVAMVNQLRAVTRVF